MPFLAQTCSGYDNIPASCDGRQAVANHPMGRQAPHLSTHTHCLSCLSARLRCHPQAPFGSLGLSGLGYGGQLRIGLRCQPGRYSGSRADCHSARQRPTESGYLLPTFGLARCLAAALVPSPGLPGFQGGEEGEGLPLRLTHVFPRFAGHFTPSTNHQMSSRPAWTLSDFATRGPSSSPRATGCHYPVPRHLQALACDADAHRVGLAYAGARTLRSSLHPVPPLLAEISSTCLCAPLETMD
jgi:hypothetical protein